VAHGAKETVSGTWKGPHRKLPGLEQTSLRVLHRHEASGTQFDPAVSRSFVPLAESEMQAVSEAVGATASNAF